MRSLINLHDELKYFLDNHLGGIRFEFEYEEQLPNLSTEGKDFPFVFATPISFNYSDNLNYHTIRIWVYNRIDRDRSNILDSTNDTSLILTDIAKWWNNDNQNSLMELTNQPSATSINNSQMDYLQGYVADFTFSIPNYNRCEVPMPGGLPAVREGEYILQKYLTCESLGTCSTFTQSIGNLQDQIDNLDVEKWTQSVILDDTELDFTRNDGSTYSVDLQPLITDIESDITTISGSVSQNIIDIQSNDSDINDLENDLSSATSSILTNQNNISSNDTDISNLQSDLNTLDSNAFQEATLNGNIIEFYTNAITVDDSVDLSPVLANYLPLTGGTITGNLTVDSKVNKAVYAENPTGTIISFTEPEIYNSATTPGTGNITDDLTNAKIGVVQKIYHNDTTAPTFPGGWVLMGSSTYTTGVLNVIYAEWSEGTRVEYWIVQEN